MVPTMGYCEFNDDVKEWGGIMSKEGNDSVDCNDDLRELAKQYYEILMVLCQEKAQIKMGKF
ncbi:hypothetical protein [Clostridium tyrobutyricum]|uniref:hypothetical protein n=1 Tax=Clostridium tyrobutyricum TaxID=1519 RepID=UPI001C38C8F1|nr:hypothetical protein [Clostridium tyrobutyricum]MBV4428733.1 hypothetical protein [Clostridium tyrobutyricum]MBV4443874.1 hypothetical protein [Clostridium tyrobutyricum]